MDNLEVDTGWNTVLEIMQERKSCRSYEYLGIDAPQKAMIVMAFESAPYASGGPRRVLREPLPGVLVGKACYDQKWVHQCPDVWLICGKDTDAMLRSGHPKYIFDCSAACMCMDLMATSFGYGTCWIGHFDPAQIREVYKLPDELTPVMILLTGRKGGGDEDDGG